MDAVVNETVDLEHIPIDGVFVNLKCSKEGLTTEDAKARLEKVGYNKLEEKKESKFLKFLGFMWNPLSWVMEVAAIMAIALANGGVFAKDVDADIVVLMAARASRTENQDAIDAAIVGMLADPKEARAGVQEVHFLPFNPTDKRTALTYIDNEGKWHRVSKGAPEQILNLAHNKSYIERRVHAVIDDFAERGLRSLAVAYQRVFGVETLQKTPNGDFRMLASAIYLQVSTISQALIFVTRSRSWSFVERPGLLLVAAFAVAQLVATLIAVYASWSFAAIEGIGWGWAGVIWLYNIITYIPLDIIKFFTRYALSGKAWDHVLERRIAFTRQKDFGKEHRELQWAHAQRTLHGLQVPDTKLFNESNNFSELNQLAEEAKRRAEIARMRELRTLKGHVESVVRLKGLDIDKIKQAYTL
ncbi:P-type H(+)-exporting transporter [Salvia divinorum]|uniref:P-type H(+)-exporting transporter n=1 Tax=Salvia divinorum TaxID=28513 RepID=A0ABD1HB94_SALDI